MNVRKTLLAAGALVAIGAGLVLVAPSAQAEGSHTGIVDKLVAKFNLDKNEVQKVFEEERAEHRAERQAKVAERLQKAVDEGKLTAEQKDKIVAKLDEVMASKPDLEGKSREEIRTLMEQKREELKQWAEDNNIPTDYLRMLGGQKHGRGMMGAR